MALKIEQIEKALKLNGGFVGPAAKGLNVTYQAVYDRIKRNARLRRTLNSIRETYLDMAENALLTKVKQGDLGAICFYLKCLGKKRGYIEKPIMGDNGDMSKPQPVQVIIQAQDCSKKVEVKNGKE